MKVDIRRFGDALAIVVPDEVAARLDMREGESLTLRPLPDGGYRLEPGAAPSRDLDAKMARAEDIMDRYRDTLDVLAK